MDEMETAKPRPVESTEDFKLHIAAIVGGNPEEIERARPLHPMLTWKKRATYPKAKRQKR